MIKGLPKRLAKAVMNDNIQGFGCPVCAAVDCPVIDSRSNVAASLRRRRRVCKSCGHRFTTYESADNATHMAQVANIRTAHLDNLIDSLKAAIDRYEELRMNPTVGA